MPNLACPVCGNSFAAWSSRCPNCGTALVPSVEDPDPLNLPDDEKVVYEVGEWPLTLQARVAEVMAESDVPHAWDGTDLVVHVDFEDTVDTLLDGVEREGIDEGLIEPSGERTGAPDEQVVYDLSDWGEADRERLAKRLDEGDIPHEWEGTSLVVAASDEAMAEAQLDAVEFPDALPAEEEADEEDGDDSARYELLSDLFDVGDRLKHNVDDEGAIEKLRAILDEADPSKPPYGFPPRVWLNALGLADEIADLLVGDVPGAAAEEATEETVIEADSGSVSSTRILAAEPRDAEPTLEPEDREERIERSASALRDLIRPYV